MKSIPYHTLASFDENYVAVPEVRELPARHHEQVRKAGASYFSIFQRTEHPCKDEINASRSEFYKLVLITQGGGQFAYGTRQYEVGPHTLVFIKPSEVRSWQAYAGEQAGFYCIFTEQFFAFTAAHLQELRSHPFFAHGANPLLQLTEQQMGVITPVFQKLYDEFNNREHYNQELIRLYLHVLLQEAHRCAAHVRPDQHHNGPSQLARRFFELLEQEFASGRPAGLTLKQPADFADKLAVHRNHLNASVKQVTGKAVRDHINDRILAEAQLLLEYTDLQVVEIADKLGFREPTHFCGFFKSKTGITPLQFRKRS